MSKLDEDVKTAVRAALTTAEFNSGDMAGANVYFAQLATSGVYLPREAASRLRLMAAALEHAADALEAS